MPTLRSATPFRLGRSAHPERLVVGRLASVMAGSGPARTSWHAQPGWKVVVAHEGVVTCETAAGTVASGALVIVPPGVEHRATATGAYTGVLFEPGALGVRGAPATDPVARPRRRMGSLARDLEELPAADVDAAAADLLDLVRRACGLPLAPVDGRLREALDLVAAAESVDRVASAVGVSAPHLRRLAHDQLSVPLVRIRGWARLRAAVVAAAPLADAAVAAGFSDQAHLSRTARRLAGRTPRELAGSVVDTDVTHR